MYHYVLVVLVIGFDFSLGQENNSKCECVPYYQCRADGTVNTYGEDVLDLRTGERCSLCNCTDSLDVCCRVPASQVSQQPAKSQPSTSCGYSNPDGVGYKSGVTSTVDQTLFGEFPWMISIYENNEYRCGGSLIHPSVVLTAAHCVKSPPSVYTLRAGDWDTSAKEILQAQDRNVSSIKPHKDFNPKNYRNDIALIFVSEPFRLANHIKLVCLVAPKTVLDENCFATGWGSKKFGPNQNGTNILKKIELPIVEKDSCQASLRKTVLGEYFNLHDSFLCAGSEKGKDTCTGDGGGPLVCPIKEYEDRYQQVGIISWGIECNDEKVPGVYANVAYLRNWIDEEMKKHKHLSSYYEY